MTSIEQAVLGVLATYSSESKPIPLEKSLAEFLRENEIDSTRTYDLILDLEDRCNVCIVDQEWEDLFASATAGALIERIEQAKGIRRRGGST